MSEEADTKPARCRHSHAGDGDSSGSKKSGRGKARQGQPSHSSSGSLRGRGSANASEKPREDGQQASLAASEASARRSAGGSVNGSLSIDDEMLNGEASSRGSRDGRSVSGDSRDRPSSAAYSTDPDLSVSTSTLRDPDGGSLIDGRGSVSCGRSGSSSGRRPGREARCLESGASDRSSRSETGSKRGSRPGSARASGPGSARASSPGSASRASRPGSARPSSRQSEGLDDRSSRYTSSEGEEDDAAPGAQVKGRTFSPFVRALQDATRRLSEGGDSTAGSLAGFEGGRVRGILVELAEELRDSESQSLALLEGIEAIGEAAQGLKKALEARFNKPADEEVDEMMEKQENTDNKRAHSRAVAAVTAAKALLAQVNVDVTTATKTATEAQAAAAEAAAAAEQAAEEVEEMEARLKEQDEAAEEEEEEEEIPEEDGGDEEEDEEDAQSTRSSIASSHQDTEEKDEVSEAEEVIEDGEKEGSDREEKKKEEAREEKPKPSPTIKRPRSVRENVLEWPHHILKFSNGDATDDEVACIIRFKADYFASQTPEFRCLAADHLSSEAVAEGEELVSRVVTVALTDGSPEQPCLEAPVVVSVPYGATSRMLSTREFLLKVRGDGEEGWKVVRTLAVDGSFPEHKGPFVEVRTALLGSFVVVARLISDRLTITKKGGAIKSSTDSRMTVSYPPGTCSLMSVSLQVQPAEHAVSDLRARMRHCSDLIAVSPLVSMTHSPDRAFDRPVTVTIPCPPNPHKTPSAGASSAGTHTGSPSAPAPTTKSAADRQLVPLSAEGAVVIRGTRSSIFGGDPSEDSLHLMHRQAGGSQWNEVEDVDFKQVRKDLVSIELDRPLDKLLILRMNSDARYPTKNVAQTFERALKIKYASIVLQHCEEDPQRVVVQCVPTRQLESALRRLSQDGYDGPQDQSPIIPMTEGQQIMMRFTGNIKIVGQEQISFTFHSQRRNMVEFTVEETNKYGNHSSEEYRGVAEFYGSPRITLVDMEDPEEVLLRDAEAKAAEKTSKHSGSSGLSKSEKKKQQEALDGTGRDHQTLRKVEADLICKIPVSLPKADPDPPLPPSRYRATAIDAGGVVSNRNLRWLSTELGNEWESLAAVLGIKRSRLQSIKRNNPIKVEQQILDMLVTWRSMLPRAYDKERKLCRALVRCGRYDLAEELKEHDAVSTQTGNTSNMNNLNVLDMEEY